MESIDRMEAKNEKRTSAFIELSRRNPVDFGMVVYKTSSVLAEGLITAELCRQQQGQSHDRATIEAVKAYYVHFDTLIEKLVSEFPDACVILVADHGMVARTHSLNPNVLLRQHGFLSLKARAGLRNSLVAMLKRGLPFKLKKILKSRLASSMGSFVNQVKFEPSLTEAFCKTRGDWSYGVYINDERFSGPVKIAEKAKLIEELINIFNEDRESLRHGITAHKQNWASPIAPDHLIYPDIILRVPPGYLITDTAEDYVAKYSRPPHMNGLEAILSGEICSQKSAAPLSVLCRYQTDQISPEGGYLTDINRLVKSILGGNE